MHIPVSNLKNKLNTDSFQIAEQLLFLEELEQLEEYCNKHNFIQLALISFSEGENMPSYFDNIRLAWYELSANFSKGECLDIGHIYEDRELLKHSFNFLKSKDILCIILSTDYAPSIELCAHIDKVSPLAKAVFSLVNAKLPFKVNHKDEINENSPLINQLFHLRSDSKINVFAYQSYYIDKLALAYLDRKDSELLRLGQLENDITASEHLLRGTNLLSFDISAIKYSEAPLNTEPKAIGISAVNACQIVRYAALSNALQCLNIYAYFGKGNIAFSFDITAGLIAQMIWFATASKLQNNEDYPVIPMYLQEYILLCKDIEYPISFFKNTRTDKWWFAMAEWEWVEKNIHNPFLISCSEKDFQMACEGELPERLWRYLIKTEF